MELPRLSGSDVSADAIVAALDEVGAVCVERYIDDDEVAALRAELEPVLAKTPTGRNEFEGYDTRRVYALFAKVRGFDAHAVDSLLAEVLDRTLGPHQLSAPVAIQIGPGEPAQVLHRDDSIYPLPWPHQPVVLNTMWALCDFTEANGATRIIPGTHLADESPVYGQAYDSIPAAMGRGSVLVWHGSLWHGGGANTTPERRVGLAMNYCAGYIRQQENQQLGIPRDVAAGFDERLQRLCGYGVYNGLIGHIDKRDPIELLRGDGPLDMVWDLA